jgi:hypothetical protein
MWSPWPGQLQPPPPACLLHRQLQQLMQSQWTPNGTQGVTSRWLRQSSRYVTVLRNQISTNTHPSSRVAIYTYILPRSCMQPASSDSGRHWRSCMSADTVPEDASATSHAGESCAASLMSIIAGLLAYVLLFTVTSGCTICQRSRATQLQLHPLYRLQRRHSVWHAQCDCLMRIIASHCCMYNQHKCTPSVQKEHSFWLKA